MIVKLLQSLAFMPENEKESYTTRNYIYVHLFLRARPIVELQRLVLVLRHSRLLSPLLGRRSALVLAVCARHECSRRDKTYRDIEFEEIE